MVFEIDQRSSDYNSSCIFIFKFKSYFLLCLLLLVYRLFFFSFNFPVKSSWLARKNSTIRPKEHVFIRESRAAVSRSFSDGKRQTNDYQSIRNRVGLDGLLLSKNSLWHSTMIIQNHGDWLFSPFIFVFLLSLFGL